MVKEQEPDRGAEVARIAAALYEATVSYDATPLAERLYDAGLRSSPAPTPCEHEWEDAPDDEEAWYCPKCGTREEPEQRADETGWLASPAPTDHDPSKCGCGSTIGTAAEGMAHK